MKKMFTKNVSVSRLSLLFGLAAGSLLTSSISYGQKTFYSRFPDPTGKYQITNAGTDCGAPAIQNPIGIADNDEGSAAYFTITTDSTAVPFNCGTKYSFDANLNLPADSPYLSPGNNAGWRITVPTGTNIQELGENLVIATYLDGVYQEDKRGNNVLAVDAGQNGKDWFVYFTATKPFNIVELVVDPHIIQLDTTFTFAVLHAFGGAVSTALPAQIANFKATVSGKNVNLSWQSLTETNVSSYRIERGNGAYTTIGTITAKGNSNSALSYSYTDKSVTDGSYLYRIVTVNNDGTTKATNSLSAVISGQGKLLLYPTFVKAGQSVTVKTSETGLVNVYLYDVQGRMVKQQRTTSSGQFSVATTGLSNGVYNVKVVSSTGVALQSKIIVN